MTSARRITALAFSILLAGCGSSAEMKEKLGLNRQAPDEYRVVPRPPLSVPPDFNLLPPGQASPYLSGLPSQERARSQVMGADTNATPATSAQNPFLAPANAAVAPVTQAPLATGADAQFLTDIGAQKADPHVRQKLLDETGGVTVQDSRYLFGGKTQSDSTVDATKEADRLKQDKAQNKPPTAGDTPVVQPEDKGLLSGIFR